MDLGDDYHCLSIATEGRVVWATIDNPPINLITRELLIDLLRFSERVAADPGSTVACGARDGAQKRPMINSMKRRPLATRRGRASAQSGTPTLLIDADLRRSSIARALKLNPKIGLVECLTGQAKLEEAILQDESSPLSILPVSVGSVAANPPDLLGSESMRALLDEARNKYGLVLVDSAPVLAVSDMRVLGQACDTLLFIAQWERTPRGAALEAVGILRQFGIPIAGVSFTRIDLKRHAKYGYGDADSYYGEYARYYSD